MIIMMMMMMMIMVDDDDVGGHGGQAPQGRHRAAGLHYSFFFLRSSCLLPNYPSSGPKLPRRQINGNPHPMCMYVFWVASTASIA